MSSTLTIYNQIVIPADSGVDAIKLTTTGARIRVDTSTNAYIYGDGTNYVSTPTGFRGGDLLTINGTIRNDTATKLTFTSYENDGASASPFVFNTANSIINATAKLLSLKNNSSEQAYFDKSGSLVVSGAVSGSPALAIPSGSRFYLDGPSGSKYFTFDGVNLNSYGGNLVINGGGLISVGQIQSASGFASWSNAPVNLTCLDSDGASAIGVKINTQNAFSTTGAKLLSVQNNSTEKAYIDKDGGFVVSGSIQTGTNFLMSGGQKIASGTGSPESAITATVGSLYLRTDGGTGTVLYVKESGSGNTGWNTTGGSGGTATAVVNPSATASITGGAANGASAIGVSLNNSISLTTTGAKLLSVQNNSTEKFAIDKDGNATVYGTLSNYMLTLQNSAGSVASAIFVGSGSTTIGTRTAHNLVIATSMNASEKDFLTLNNSAGSLTLGYSPGTESPGTIARTTIQTNLALNANATGVVGLALNAPNGATADLQQWKVNNAAKASLSKDGAFTCSGVSAGSISISVPAGTYIQWGTGPLITTGSGTPEGVVTAPIGSLFMRTNGGAATTLYVKESGTGNTGWIAK